MYFWRIHLLKKKLISSPLSEREVLPYLVLHSTLTAIVLMFPIWLVNSWDYFGSSWSVLLAVCGTVYIYRMNGGSSGELLLQRLLTIGWVVSIRWSAAMLCAIVIYLAVVEFTSGISEDTTWLEFVLQALAEVFLYWRIGQHVSEVAVGVRSNTSLEHGVNGIVALPQTASECQRCE